MDAPIGCSLDRGHGAAVVGALLGRLVTVCAKIASPPHLLFVSLGLTGHPFKGPGRNFLSAIRLAVVVVFFTYPRLPIWCGVSLRLVRWAGSMLAG